MVLVALGDPLLSGLELSAVDGPLVVGMASQSQLDCYLQLIWLQVKAHGCRPEVFAIHQDSRPPGVGFHQDLILLGRERDGIQLETLLHLTDHAETGLVVLELDPYFLLTANLRHADLRRRHLSQVLAVEEDLSSRRCGAHGHLYAGARLHHNRGIWFGHRGHRSVRLGRGSRRVGLTRSRSHGTTGSG